MSKRFLKMVFIGKILKFMIIIRFYVNLFCLLRWVWYGGAWVCNVVYWILFPVMGI